MVLKANRGNQKPTETKIDIYPLGWQNYNNKRINYKYPTSLYYLYAIGAYFMEVLIQRVKLCSYDLIKNL